MRIKLISPKMSLRPMDTAFKTQMSPPLALLTLAALTPAVHSVLIADENIEHVSTDDSPDLVGITVKADTAKRSWTIASAYRSRGIPVILGGIYATTCPDENLPHCDAVVIGEAEHVWCDILADAQAKSLKSTYRGREEVDLSSTPLPTWDLIREKQYLFTNTLTIGRGCPWQCDFCYSSSPNVTRGYRAKPIPKILDEVRSLRTKHVMFIDDNFIADLDVARRLAKALAPLGITWHTAVSANIGFHDDILDLLAASGCKSLFIGFETLSASNLQEANKHQNSVGTYEDTIRKIHARRMQVNASVVFGFDHDDPRVFVRTTDWLIDQKVGSMTAHILTPYPGTRLYDRMREEGRIIDNDLDHYNTSYAVFIPRLMTREELEAGYQRAYERFYSWRSILARMPGNIAQIKPYLLFNLGYRKYGALFSLIGKAGLMRRFGDICASISYAQLQSGHAGGSKNGA